MTKYTVFRQAAGAASGQSGGGHWVELGDVEAVSSKGAIALYLTKTEEQTGTFAAVPSRSFKPVTVKAETKLSFK